MEGMKDKVFVFGKPTPDHITGASAVNRFQRHSLNDL